jgi:LPXTG-motif cell wall-anchored protein
VTVRDKEEYVSRFPFSVGEPKGTSPYLIVAIAALIGAAAVFFLRGRKKSAPA